MKVYAEFFEKNEIQYRKTTLLQFGDSFNLIGSAVLMNPGKAEKMTTISSENFVSISKFFNSDRLNKEPWFCFSGDRTMNYLVKIFNGYYIHGKEELLNGVIQLFNLFNIKDENIIRAKQKYKENNSSHLYQSATEIISLLKDKPVYLGWGNDYTFSEELKSKVDEIFRYVLSNGGNYLDNDFKKNKFYHPRYINSYYLKNEQIKQILVLFYNSLHK